MKLFSFICCLVLRSLSGCCLDGVKKGNKIERNETSAKLNIARKGKNKTEIISMPSQPVYTFGSMWYIIMQCHSLYIYLFNSPNICICICIWTQTGWGLNQIYFKFIFKLKKKFKSRNPRTVSMEFCLWQFLGLSYIIQLHYCLN